MSRWTLEATTARWRSERLTAAVDLKEPSRGLHQLVLGGAALSNTELLAIELALGADDELSLPETYARGDDLVATYLQTAARPFRLQAYWRRLNFADHPALDGCEGFELQVSINTSLLDTRPAVDVVSRVPGKLDAAVDGASVIVRPAGLEHGLLTVAHPLDQSTTTIGADDGGCRRIAHRLFGRHLEKGVILRARVRGVILPRADDEALAQAVRDDFAAAPLPLTT